MWSWDRKEWEEDTIQHKSRVYRFIGAELVWESERLSIIVAEATTVLNAVAVFILRASSGGPTTRLSLFLNTILVFIRTATRLVIRAAFESFTSSTDDKKVSYWSNWRTFSTRKKHCIVELH